MQPPAFHLATHAVWTVAGPKRLAAGEVPKLPPPARLAVRRLVEMLSLGGRGASHACLHELAARAVWELSHGAVLLQVRDSHLRVRDSQALGVYSQLIVVDLQALRVDSELLVGCGSYCTAPSSSG